MASEQDPQNVPSEAEDEMELEMDEGGEDFEFATFSQSDRTTQGGEEEEIAEEIFSRLGESSDNPDQKRLYLEYLSLIKDINCQNQTVDELKMAIMEMCAKPCKSRCEMKNIKKMRVCMEQENIKLRCLMNKAMQLQNFGSHRRYLEIPISTTIDEDNMKPYVGCIPPQSSNWKGEDSSDNEKTAVRCKGHKEEKGDNTMRNLCKIMEKLKLSCPNDRKLIKEIAKAMLTSTCKTPKKPDSPCKQVQHRPMPDIESNSVDRIKNKIACMQMSVNKLKHEICQREHEKQQDREREQECQHGRDKQRGRDLEWDCSPETREKPDPIIQCTGARNTKLDQIEKLKENYLYLLAEFAKKDCKVKELEQRLRGFCGSCDGGKTDKAGDLRNADKSELELLRVRVSEMKEEQVEFKCIMKEQSHQLEDYRNKYLIAQQKVEEQNVTLEKLNMNNKRIEKQINTEIKEIRAKFQEKLNELLHFPKLLENEQLKLAQICKEKDEVSSKLKLVCKEYQALKTQMESKGDTPDCRPMLTKCQVELEATKKKLDEMTNQRDLFCEQLKTMTDDLDTLRSESAKIIARTKERSEMIKQQQQEKIDRLEKELAQCRATACLSVTDREAVIREMQGQLNTLSYSFDAAQKQIKTLKNHVAYVSNENCFPVRC